MSRGERAQVAMRATLTAFGVLVLFAVAGLAILAVFGITIHAFRIAGGVLLFFIAFEMIFERRQDRQGKERRDGAGRPHPQHRGLSARHPADRRAGRDLRDDPALRHATPSRSAARS